MVLINMFIGVIICMLVFGSSIDYRHIFVPEHGQRSLLKRMYCGLGPKSGFRYERGTSVRLDESAPTGCTFEGDNFRQIGLNA
jgi:hypothetical protein